MKGSNRRKKYVTQQLKVRVKATITATKEQLVEIGCDRDLMKLELDVTDIDKWGGMYYPCSTVYYSFLSFEEEYIIPTRWLTFK
jgi:hypothetical protein